MPNFSKLFQEEVRRLAKKELKDELARLVKSNTELRKGLSDAKKKIAELQKAVRGDGRRKRGTSAEAVSVGAEGGEAADRKRISSKTIRTLRQRLGLTQGEFAKLVGVTGQSIYQWESKEGQLRFRGGAKERILAVKSIGAREARKRLEAMNVVRKRGPRTRGAAQE